jgi:putative Mn2+ efflux pump MntP
MDIMTMILIGLGLAMDAFAVSISRGVTLKKFHIGHAFRIALFFGGFQAIMPLLGWSAGFTFKAYVETYSHWIAFIILVIIGFKMIYESIFVKKEHLKCEPNNLLVLTGLAIATSLDALAVGVSFSLLNITITEPILVIGTVTFILSFIGVFLGDRFGILFGNRIEIIGCIVLILIGLKILFKI